MRVPATVKKHRSKDKIVKSRSSLVGIVESLRSQGKLVALTNGCFDLLHVGHVRCLEDAKSRCDFLIVAVNGDKTVAELKGTGFPIHPVQERMETVAGLESVDYVIAFEEATADRLLKQVKPTHYAKGTDYTERTLPERDTVKEIGAKVLIVGDKKNHSTSKTVQKIRKGKFDS